MTTQPFKTIVLDLLQQGHLDEETFLQELDETERTAIGAPQLWSAKDHVVHRTFWHQRLIGDLTAALQHQEAPPREESDDQINARVFEANKARPWSAIHADSERVYADIITLVEQLSEDDLTAPIASVRLPGKGRCIRPSWAASTNTTRNISCSTIPTGTTSRERYRSVRNAVLATWIIRSKTGPSRRRKIDIPCLHTEAGWCTIRRCHKHTHA